MKYDGKKYIAIAGKELNTVRIVRKKTKKTSGNKPVLSLTESIKIGFTPSFSYHALVRISERLQPARVKVVDLVVGNARVYGPLLGHWIDPKLLRHIIEDVRSNVAGKSYWNEKDSALLVWGKVACYIVDDKQTIITVYKEPNKGQLHEMGYKLAPKRFIATYFSIEQKLAKK